ncbi:MAG: Trk system potassium transporter TrkA [Holosporales bacterium]|jgi:trk system potassium uptake protein TrkA|nr:Trk system potassium transporter TrkA [Holosporales bacterium]
MNILILGAGQVGASIAQHLVSPENHVTIVDNNEQVLSKLEARLDIRPVLGYAAHPNILEKAGAQNSDILIAVTNIDEVNMVACEVVNSLFKDQIKIARIRDQNFLSEKQRNLLFQKDHISIDYIISPEVEIAKNISKGLQIGTISSVIDIFDNAKMISIKCLEHSPVLNTSVKLLFSLFPTLNMSIIAIQRDGNTFIPDLQDIIQLKDNIFAIVAANQITEAISAFGNVEQNRKSITLAGGGNIGKILAEEIEKKYSGVSLRIIEKNTNRLDYLSHFLKKAEFLAGDVCDLELLQESEIGKSDTFISITNNDKTNIFSALLAKHLGTKHVTALLSDQKLAPFASSLGIDSLIDPNAITVATILKYTKQNKIRSLYSIDSCIEVIEINVDESSNIIGLSTTEDIMIPGQIIIAAMKREGELVLFPENITVIANDKLIIVVTTETVYKIERILATRTID